MQNSPAKKSCTKHHKILKKNTTKNPSSKTLTKKRHFQESPILPM
jgi:hypothetical protein